MPSGKDTHNKSPEHYQQSHTGTEGSVLQCAELPGPKPPTHASGINYRIPVGVCSHDSASSLLPSAQLVSWSRFRYS